MRRAAPLGDTLVYGVAATFAVLNANHARLVPHRIWGEWASWPLAVCTLAAAAMCLAERGPRRVVAAVAVLAGTIIPTVALCVQRTDSPEGRAQSEVLVVEAMARRAIETGTPYLTAEEIRIEAAKPRVGFRAYAPYQPAMAAFGAPRAIETRNGGDGSWFTDARITFLAIGAALAAATTVIARLDPIRCAQAFAVIPPAALAIATGGHDVPVIASCTLAIALADRRRWGWAGVAVGVGLAIKLTAAPVVVVLLAFAWTIDERRGASRLAWGAIGLPLATVLPLFLGDPDALIENLIRYPLGISQRATTAASPLPGVLLAEHVSGGRAIAGGLVIACALALAWRLRRRPPRQASEAAWLAAAVMTGAVVFAPAARFGYLMYPIVFAAVAWLISNDSGRSDNSERPKSSGLATDPITAFTVPKQSEHPLDTQPE